MPPAKSDLKTWAGGRSSGNDGSSTSMKVACTGCRKIKVRCLRPLHDNEQNVAGTMGKEVPCLRCSRLDIPCQVKPHRKGARMDTSQGGEGDDQTKSMDLTDSTEGSNKEREKGGGQWERNFSIQSLLDDRDGPAMQLLDKLTVKTSLSEPATNPTINSSRSRRSSGHDIDIVQNGIFTLQEAERLHVFFFEKLNGILSLLTPSLNTFAILISRRSTQFLLSAICTVSSRYVLPEKYLVAIKYIQSKTGAFTEGALTASLENCQALSILTMWRHPQDASGWRKLHGAIIMAYELNLHNIAKRRIKETDSMKMQLAQAQRTYFHLGCFEEFFVNQRQILPLVNWEIFQHPRQWIESLGSLCNELDIRIASAMDTIGICHRLSENLKQTRSKMPKGRAESLQEARLIRLALAEQEIASSVWLHAKDNGLPANFAMRACGVFDNVNYRLNYWQTIYAIYCRPEMKASCFDKDRENAFTQASDMATELVELFDGSYGENEYYRYVHEHVTCSLAAAGVWIVDNWRAMTKEAASRAHNAMRKARDVTLPSKSRLLEQSAYLHRFLNFCCGKLPPQPVIDQTSPIEINDLGLSKDLYWLLEKSDARFSSAIAFDMPQQSGPSNWQQQLQQQQQPSQQQQQQDVHMYQPQQINYYDMPTSSDNSYVSPQSNLGSCGQSSVPFLFEQDQPSRPASNVPFNHNATTWSPTQTHNYNQNQAPISNQNGATHGISQVNDDSSNESILSFYQRLLQESISPSF